MSPPPGYTSPFPPLDLTIADKEKLMHTANGLIDEVQQKYENFLWHDKEKLSVSQWHQVREKENVRVYHDRRPGAGTGNKDMHLLLTFGTIKARLNDAMYGVLNHTTDDMRIKTAYVKDTLLDCAVLETLLEPTPDKPFQSMTVRWFVKGMPLYVRAMTRHRDIVYLEATGTRVLSNGERVGFHFMQSITFDKTPPLPMYERFDLSLCSLWRQVSPQCVQLYTTSYVTIGDSFMTPFVVKSMAEALASFSQYMECAQKKKLSWLVRQKTAFTQLSAAGGALKEEGCSVCGSQSRSTRKGVRSACVVCGEYTCSKCRVKRELSVFAPDGQLMMRAMRFCLPCVTSVNQKDAAEIARDDATRAAVAMSTDRSVHHLVVPRRKTVGESSLASSWFV